MKATFYGTRGSLPICDPAFQEFGGNTTCVQLTGDLGKVLILDAGTGIRNLGRDLIESHHQQEGTIFLALSHFHWDHIQGFPFFAPAYDPKQHFTITAVTQDSETKDLKSIFAAQMQQDYFPIPFDQLGANFEFLQLRTGTFLYGQTVVRTYRHNHPGGAFTFRFEHSGKVLVFCTDIEHGDSIDPQIVELAQEADLLIHDAQYTPEELKQKKGWGHSSWEQAVEVAKRSGTKRLALTHHDPDHNDEFLKRVEEKCQRSFSNAVFAREKMVIEF